MDSLLDAVAEVPWLADGKLFVTYEDPQSVDAKCAFAHENGLGGAMVWQMAEGYLPDASQPLVDHASHCR